MVTVYYRGGPPSPIGLWQFFTVDKGGIKKLLGLPYRTCTVFTAELGCKRHTGIYFAANKTDRQTFGKNS